MSKTTLAQVVGRTYTVDLAGDSLRRMPASQSGDQAITALDHDPDLMIFRLNGVRIVYPAVSFPKPGDVVRAGYHGRGM